VLLRWIITVLRVNIGLALTGALVREFAAIDEANIKIQRHHRSGTKASPRRRRSPQLADRKRLQRGHFRCAVLTDPIVSSHMIANRETDFTGFPPEFPMQRNGEFLEQEQEISDKDQGISAAPT
jgi:hypothetical protein